MFDEKPEADGLSKKKLWILIASFFGVVVGIIIYFTVQDNGIKQKEAEEKTTTNYVTANSGNGDDILAAAHQNRLAATNIASSPVAQVKVKTDSDSKYSDAILQAMRAPLNSNQLKSENAAREVKDSSSTGSITNEDSGLAKDDQNQTAEKRAFIKSHSKVATHSVVKNRLGDYVLSMGTKIPAQVDQDINSDLPGQIYGHVTRDVYDSRTHNVLLIPAGSNLVGTYDSSVAYGQSRLLVAWTRVNLPNGQFIDLPGFGGADPVGAGFGDQVDNHYDKIFGATVLISILAAGAQLSQPQQTSVLQTPTVGQTIGQSVGTQIAQTGTTLMNKNLNLQPTLHIRPGFEFTVEVNKDLVFPGKYSGNNKKS